LFAFKYLLYKKRIESIEMYPIAKHKTKKEKNTRREKKSDINDYARITTTL